MACKKGSKKTKKTKVCPACGEKVNAKDETCPECGAEIEKEAE